MILFEQLAEQKIVQALESGVFDDLQGKGLPLNLDDDASVPKELRLGFRILKNAGITPREIQVLNEISKLKQQVKLTKDKNDQQLVIHQISILRINNLSKTTVSTDSRL